MADQLASWTHGFWEIQFMMLKLFWNIDLISVEFDRILAGEKLCRFFDISADTKHRRSS